MTAVAEQRPRSRVLRKIVAYSASRGVTEGLLGVRGIALAILLGPAMFGIWALLRLTMRYTALIGSSVYRGLELELVAEHARQRDDAPAQVALGFVLAASGTLAAAALAVSFMLHNPRYILLLRGFAVAVVAEQVYSYSLVCIRVRQDLRRYAIVEMTYAALQLGCVLVFAWLAGIGGAFAGLAVASLGAVALAGREVDFQPVFRWRTLVRLLREGVPLALNGMLASALSTADRWIVAGFGGVTMLGYYAFAAQVGSVAATFAWVVRTVIFPAVYRDARSERTAPALRMHLERAVLPFARLLPPLLGAGSLLVGPVLVHFLPKYEPAIGPARIFLLAGTAAGVVSLAAIGAVAAGKQQRLPVISAVALALNLTLSFLSVLSGAGLAFVAGASFVGQVTFAVGTLVLVHRASDAANASGFVARALAPLVWCTTLVVAIGWLLPSYGVRTTVFKLTLYLALLAPLVPALRADWRRVRA